jgi:hypothetical protein
MPFEKERRAGFIVVRFFQYLSLISLFFAVFATSHVKISDPDFWWHLKTGEYISQNGAIPKEDPFSYTSPSPPTPRVKFILRQYWLAQVLFYRVYQMFGSDGIIFFRALFFTLLFFVLYLGIRMDNNGHYLAYFLTFLAAVIVLDFIGERPNQLSFLFSLVLVCLFEGFMRRTARELPGDFLFKTARFALYPIPFTMVLWSNMHGGFILGDVIIIVYVFSEWIQFRFRIGSGEGAHSALQKRHLRQLVLAGGAAIACSFINPNGYGVVAALLDFRRSALVAGIAEHAAPWVVTSVMSTYPYWFLVFLAVVVLLITVRHVRVTHLVLIAFLVVLSLHSVRYMPFFALISSVILPRYLHPVLLRLGAFFSSSSLYQRIIDKLNRAPIIQSGVSLAVTLFFVAFILFSMHEGLAFQRGIDESAFPVRAADFLEVNGLKGRMFNHLDVGGYLIWRLYPQQKTFIDNRTLSEDTFVLFNRIMGASRKSVNGLPEWKAIVNDYGIELIITFSVNRREGEIFPLIPALMSDEEWQLIYLDGNFLIFVRDLPGNREVIERFRKPKDRIYDQIILETMERLRVSREPTLLVTMGDAFLGKEMVQEAVGAYGEAMRLDPRNKAAMRKLSMLGYKGYR